MWEICIAARISPSDYRAMTLVERVALIDVLEEIAEERKTNN